MIDRWATECNVKLNPIKSESLLISRKKAMTELNTCNSQKQQIIIVENHTHLRL